MVRQCKRPSPVRRWYFLSVFDLPTSVIFFTQKQIRKSGWVAKNCLDVILIMHKNCAVGILFVHLVEWSIQDDRCAKFCWFLFDQSVHHVTTATWISVNVDWFLFEQLRRRQRCLVPNEISTGIEDKTRPGPTDIFPVFSCTWKASQIPWTRLETFSMAHRNVESLAGSYLIADFTCTTVQTGDNREVSVSFLVRCVCYCAIETSERLCAADETLDGS